MAAPAFGAIGTRFAASSATPAVAVPAGVTADQIIVIYMHCDVSTITITTPPAGFAAAQNSPITAGTGAGSSSVLHVLWKRATGADSGTYAFTNSASSFVYARAARYTSAITTGTPFDSPTSAADGGNTLLTTTPAVSVTTAGPDRLLCFAATNWNGDGSTWGNPASFAQREGGASVTNLYAADLAQAAQGSSGTVQATTGSGKLGAWLGAMIGTTVTSTGSPIIVQPPRRP